MPGGNGTGPEGLGPMTGRGAGFCAGYSLPGYANSVGGRGMGMGRGRGRGLGRGFGWGRAGYVLPAHGGGVSFAPTVAHQQELDSLKGQAEYLVDVLDGIKKRIKELESQKSDKD